MRRAFLLTLSWTLLLASGCGKNESSSEGKLKPLDMPEKARETAPSGVVPPPAKDDGRPLIVTFGDSLSEGFGAESGQSYPDHLQRMLDAKGFRYRVVNQGISGDTTTGGVNRISAAVALKPAIVILELGGNDGLRGIPVSATRANLERMIQQLQAAEIRVVLAGMSLPPNYGPDYIKSFESAYRDLARQYKCALIPFLLADILAAIQKQPDQKTVLMQGDGIHPTAKGNEMVAATVFRYLEPLLKKG